MVLCFVLVIFTVLLACCSAKVYKVGDSDGWTAKKDYYYDWVKGKEFHVGDSLVFEYDPKLNDVTQVSGAMECEFCDYSYPKAVYNTGHDVCLYGQKLNVLVVQDPSRPVPPPPPRKILPPGKFYKVGDYKGWNVYDSDFYNKWSEEKTFYVGDSLFFEYGNKVNDVLEISGHLEFNYCDTTSPVAVHKTGHDLVRLTKPGVHYFISSETGHCEAGLKLRVMVQDRSLVQPLPKVPRFSPIDRFTRWLRTLRHHHP
ncbi:unnamed protein product [Arabis nemorensis]|uniref:Phytocyanin domain-containing protein n=1 Tax=Arabis nemorensis TaxID=586526 RepID=A0A565BZS2_9BRAS|nr:unnamed protein product [Arabis nemorensis]